MICLMSHPPVRSAGRGLEREMEQLRDVSYEALLDLFPEELSPGWDALKEKAIDVGSGALGVLLKGGDPLSHVQR